jgi:hypothetical protein
MDERRQYQRIGEWEKKRDRGQVAENRPENRRVGESEKKRG